MENQLIEESERAAAAWEAAWYTIRNSKLIIAVAFLTTVLTAYLFVQMRPELYEAKARVLVKLGRENVEVPVTVEKGGVVASGVRKEEINSYVLLLSSRELVEATIDDIGLEAFRFKAPVPETLWQHVRIRSKLALRWVKKKARGVLEILNLKKKLTEREAVIVGVQSALDVARERDSDVIVARMRFPDPGLAVRFIDRLITLYRDRHIAVRRGDASSDFFRNKSEEYRQRLRELAASKATLEAKYALTAIDEERKLLLQRVQSLYAEIAKDEQEKALLFQGLKAAAPGSAPPGAERADEATAGGAHANGQGTRRQALRGTDLERANPSFALMKDRITQLRMRRIELYSAYSADSRMIAKIDGDIAALETVLWEALDRRIAEKRRKAENVEARLRELNRGEDELEVIEREQFLANRNYLSYSRRWEEARISEELDRRRVANISILSPPSLPIEPVSPRKLLTTGLSIPAGLLLGVGLAFLIDYLEDRIRMPRDLSGIEGLNYLGSFDREP
jgi:uncharacterized protein involved in exopolysaccharide biosynthesis